MILPGDWTIPQILQTTDALRTLPSHPNKQSVGASVTAIISSTLSEKGPRGAIKLINLLQPLLMESLLMDGFSISLKGLDGRCAMQKANQSSSLETDKFNKLTVDSIVNSSALGLLVDPKKDSTLKKLVEQIGFLGQQLQRTGRLYSSNLVEDCYNFLERCSGSTKCYDPSKGHDFVTSSFYNGLNPYEELLHSISVREKIERSSSKGLAESGNLFKNMMAMLRDVTVCYDGTMRTSCSNSIVQFDSTNVSSSVTPGDPVGILAATAFVNAAYKAVLDPVFGHSVEHPPGAQNPRMIASRRQGREPHSRNSGAARQHRRSTCTALSCAIGRHECGILGRAPVALGERGAA
jgi:hypothetical protein